MTTSAYLDAQMIRCGSCGTLLGTSASVCNTCLALAHRDEGRDWTDDALCRQVDPELWFPESESGAGRRVFDICAKCPVKRNCLRVGLHENYGIWAGWTSRQRQELRDRVVRLKPSARHAIVNQAADVGASYLHR